MSKSHASTIEAMNRQLRREIIADLKYVIRDLTILLSGAENGESLYAQSLQGSTMLGLTGKIEVLRAQERIEEMMK